MTYPEKEAVRCVERRELGGRRCCSCLTGILFLFLSRRRGIGPI
jgi:hypothetical protein